MKSLPFNMIVLHIQAEVPYLLGAPDHTLQHCHANFTHVAEMHVLQIPNLYLVHLSLDVTPCKEVQGH